MNVKAKAISGSLSITTMLVTMMTFGEIDPARGDAAEAEAAVNSIVGDGVSVTARADGIKARVDNAVAEAAVAEALKDTSEAKKSEEARGGGEGETGPRKATIKIGGDPRAKFSGKCLVGEEEKAIDVRGPELYAYELGDEKLQCEIRKDGEGALTVVLTSGDSVRSVQRAGGERSVTIIAYSNNAGASASMSQMITSSFRPTAGVRGGR